MTSCTHPNFTILQYCPHWHELGKDGYVVECRSCGERKHRWTFTLPPRVPAAFPFWAQAEPSEEELAELVRKEREGCPVRQEGV